MKNLHQLANIQALDNTSANNVKGGACDDRKRVLTGTSGSLATGITMDATMGKILQKAWGGTTGTTTTLGGFSITPTNG